VNSASAPVLDLDEDLSSSFSNLRIAESEDDLPSASHPNPHAVAYSNLPILSEDLNKTVAAPSSSSDAGRPETSTNLLDDVDVQNLADFLDSSKIEDSDPSSPVMAETHDSAIIPCLVDIPAIAVDDIPYASLSERDRIALERKYLLSSCFIIWSSLVDRNRFPWLTISAMISITIT
jgi:hypothetical protein